MRLGTDQLTPQQRRRVHPDFLENEQGYRRLRDGLLRQYRGQWVAVHGGRVVAAGSDVVQVLRQAASTGAHPFIARVGEEDSTFFRIRREQFAYDSAYQPFPMPRVAVTFWNDTETRSRVYPDVIPDTGADLCVLPEADCDALDLFSSPYFLGVSRGVLGGPVPALICQGKAEVNGRRVPALIQPVADSTERLMGRDVLRHHRVIFDGPAGWVAFEP